MNSIYLKKYKPGIGDIIVDIGAGQGDEAVIFAEWVGSTGHIYAVEANPTTFKHLKKSCQINNVTNVECYNLALHNKNGKVYIEDGQHWFSNKLVNNQGVEVNAITLDNFILAENI